MDYHCDIYDKTNIIYPERKNLQNLTHNDLMKSIQLKHTIAKLGFLDIDEVFNDCITNLKKISIRNSINKNRISK